MTARAVEERHHGEEITIGHPQQTSAYLLGCGADCEKGGANKDDNHFRVLLQEAPKTANENIKIK